MKEHSIVGDRMPMPLEWYERYRGLVKIVAAQWAFKYRQYVEVDDVSQELWLWFGKHVKKVQEWENNEALPEKEVDKLISKSLHNFAYDYCLREKLAREGVEFGDLHWYTPDFIKTMLPGVLLGDWKKIQDLVEGSINKSFKDASEGNNVVAYTADIKKAYESLSEDEKVLVLEFYAKDQSSSEVKQLLHKSYGEPRSPHALAMAAHRATIRMSKFLGGLPPWKDNDE